MPAIKPDRVLGDLYKLRSFGTYKTGVHRPTFSPEDIAARNWFAGQCTAAGLETTIDGIANIFAKSNARGPKALSGSHLESQNHAGWLDGPLGCVYALEASRAIKEAGGDTGVDVVVFCDEEGHYGSFLGSKAFFEAHIEQGDTLESEKLHIGVVTAIVAIWQYSFTATGEQNHAGTTSMTRRRDAGLALVRLLSAIDRRFPEICGPRTVWTTGRITLEPGSHSIIPGAASSLFQLRDADPAVLDRLHAELFTLVDEANRNGRCKVELTVISQSTPAK